MMAATHAPEPAACDDLLVKPKQVQGHPVEHSIWELGPVDVAAASVAEECYEVRHELFLTYFTDGCTTTVVVGNGLQDRQDRDTKTW
jgi:hypothetical protein